MDDPHDLARFVAAQGPVFDAVLAELGAGKKRSHWMWFVFPQIAGLGVSDMARRYAIRSLDEARAYLEHPLLGARLRRCTDLVLAAAAGRSALDVLGAPDDAKFRSSMTLFGRASGGEPRFGAALARFFGGAPDAATLVRLESTPTRGRFDAARAKVQGPTVPEGSTAMSLAERAEPDRFWMPIDAFRALQATRPDEERWELIDGVPVMMTPTYLTHARIAGNVERLLSDALDAFDPGRTALQNVGVDLGLSGQVLPGLGRAAGYAPQPDVAVIDAAFADDLRFASPLYVAVEVVSGTDAAWVASVGLRWIEAKTQIYQAHAACEAVLAVEQHRIEARLSLRTGAGWERTVLTRPDDVLHLPTCGLARTLADVYRGTPVLRGAARP